MRGSGNGNGDERLTESVRVRLTASEKDELDRRSAAEQRSSSAVARRGIKAELARLSASLGRTP